MNTLTISENLYNHYESTAEIKHYYGLLANYALVLTAEANQNKELLTRCKNIMRKFPNQIEHPNYNFPSYKIGGIPKAYMFMKGYLPEAESEIRDYADEMMTAVRDDKGIVTTLFDQEKKLIWIDAAMATTPFLLFAGLGLKEEKYIDEAVNQAFLMYEEFFDEKIGLLHQCKNFVGEGLYSQDHWSRGNGWGYFALTELVKHLPKQSPHRKKAEKYFIQLSNALLPHQSKRGLWRQEIPLEYSYEESSGTGLILYGLGTGLRLGLLEFEAYNNAFHKGIRGLNDICINEDFSTEQSCPGCLCPGEEEEKGTVKAYVTLKLPYKDEPHSFGPFMLALAEAYQNGIIDLNRLYKG
ncbi:glycoside hydrolase family 88 protein [Gracilibacillus kekensis]|uniref:Unsaturated rhamnogalacturonyl hydrolase n=1 Tax=Gracilibacillus kekensis TaxID=1027249 RepID=A0A1M7QT99_9BACI|nr:glycoside hydrolase family 88 protein [Gracilibacillus kekensis]SHN34893.1 unsaturated rhamnogalacturonyl hydrolase [Gracilibacillus kekensis]